jgi:hypothetical protein
MLTAVLPVFEREEKVWGGGETKLAVLKVPRQCPLVLLVEVRLVCGIYSILILLKKLERLQWGEM